jgi:signal transduction histidine kinase
MQLSFRRRLFLAMIALGTVPLAIALLVLALQVRSAGSPTGVRATLDEIAQSGGELVGAVDTMALDEQGRAAFRTHTETIAAQTTLARRAEWLSRIAAGVLGFLILVAAVVLIAVSLGLARRWSRYVSAPIEELVAWVRKVERKEELPQESDTRGAPEFDDLRSAARERELEQERLRAFRETARRVAHEMRGPITASRLALRRLEGSGQDEMLTVLDEETQRLERMSHEFSEFGRLPEGPEAEIDVVELVDSVVNATIPTGVPSRTHTEEPVSVRGHYEPLRRALQNLVRNAVEVVGPNGVDVSVARKDGMVRITVADDGPGIPADARQRVFDPYFTTKKHGTGLGLALVKQTVLAHDGTIDAEESPEGGAMFVINLPENA